jgi:hypothetical protein
MKALYREAFSLSVVFCSIASAPSEARLCQSEVDSGTESPGQASGTECCVGIGNDDGEAYTRR